MDCHTIFGGRPGNPENRLITRGVAFIENDAHLRMLLQYSFKIRNKALNYIFYRISGLAMD